MNSSREMAPSAGRRISAVGGLLTRYRYAVVAGDQVAISLLNFGLAFALLRALSAPEFGTVALWMAVANLPIMVQGALVLTPLSVYVPAEPDESKRRRLEEALASSNLLIILFSVLAVLMVNVVSHAEWVPKDRIAWAAIPLYVGTVMYREYYRFFAFSRNDMKLLVMVDGPYLVVTAACISAMLVWPERLAGLAGAFAALTLGGMAAWLCGGLRLRRLQLRMLRAGWNAPYRGIFGEVLWSLAGVVSSHLQERSYVYITTSLVGLAQLASLNAAAVLFRPAQILLTAWRRSAMPEFSVLLAAGRVDAVYRRVLAASAAALSGSVAWGAMLWFGWRAVEHYLLAGKYPEASLLLLPWAIVICLDAIEFIASTALQAAREFRYLAWVTLMTAPITVTATAALTLWHGYTWTMYGLAIGNGLSATMVVARLVAARRRLVALAPEPASGAAARSATG